MCLRNSLQDAFSAGQPCLYSWNPLRRRSCVVSPASVVAEGTHQCAWLAEAELSYNGGGGDDLSIC